ncbi:MAG: hypothetical protein ACM3JQ_02455 [Candidatus Eiseniibacteriota bacterium]
MQAQPLNGYDAGKADVRPVLDENDISLCNELCKSVHGFSREKELRQAKDQGVCNDDRTKQYHYRLRGGYRYNKI